MAIFPGFFGYSDGAPPFLKKQIQERILFAKDHKSGMLPGLFECICCGDQAQLN